MRVFIQRTKDRFVWSWNGLAATWRGEHSFRYWVWANLGSGGLALILPLSAAEQALIIALGVLVMAFELINTAVEHTVDYISEEHHPMAGKAKDAASAAVMMSACAVGAAWAVILIRMLL